MNYKLFNESVTPIKVSKKRTEIPLFTKKGEWSIQTIHLLKIDQYPKFTKRKPQYGLAVPVKRRLNLQGYLAQTSVQQGYQTF